MCEGKVLMDIEILIKIELNFKIFFIYSICIALRNLSFTLVP